MDPPVRAPSDARPGPPPQLPSPLTELEAIYASAPIGLAVLDRELRFVRVNQRLARINGLPVDAHLGRHVREVVPDLTGQSQALLRRILETGEPVREVELVGETPARPGVGRAWIEHWSPVRDAGGNVVGVSVVAEEVTGLRQAEAALREADRRKDEFLAVLAHELRSPLESLGNLLRVMEREPLSSPGRRMLELGRRQFALLSRLVDDLLDVSRIGRGELALRTERLPVQRILHEVAGVLGDRMRALDQRLELALPDEPVWVDADALRLAQVMENLLSNASKYTDRGGRVRVVLRRTPREAVVEVRDTGVGIPADARHRIFEMFARLEPSPEHGGGGLGIGLALVRQLVELHGGQVGVHSDGPGRGATFTVALPLGRRLSIPPDGASDASAGRASDTDRPDPPGSDVIPP